MKRPADFQSIRSAGGLLPPDPLRRVLDPSHPKNTVLRDALRSAPRRIPTRFAAPWTPSRRSSASRCCTRREIATWPPRKRQAGCPSTSPTGGWSGIGTAVS